MRQDSYIQQIYERICDAKPQTAFVILDFCDLTDYDTAKKSLLRLEEKGKIQRIIRGVYYNPRFSQLLQEYEAPSVDEVAKALARNYNWTIAPSGNAALNQLGLSTQVPAKWIYISDGPYKKYKIGNQELEFKHWNNKEISGMSEKTNLVIQALKAMGEMQIDDCVIKKLRKQLSDLEKEKLMLETRQTTVWLQPIIKQIAREDHSVCTR